MLLPVLGSEVVYVKKKTRHIDPAEQVAILHGLGGKATDGYSNAAAFLGEYSPLIASARSCAPG